MRSNSNLKLAVMLGLVGAAAGTASAQVLVPSKAMAPSAPELLTTAPHTINITGATLFESFFGSAPQSTFDAIDCDADGNARLNPPFNGVIEQLAPTGINPDSGWWAVQYRAVGSGNGLAEMVNWGTRFAHNPLDMIQSGLDNGYCNRVKWYDGNTGPQGGFNTANPGGLPFRTDETTLLATYAPPGNPSAGGARIDLAIMDVPTTWFITQSGTASPTATPTAAGYGNNGRQALNPDGTVQGQSNKLKSLRSSDNAVTLNLNTASPDQFTVFDSPIAAAPIAFMANYGTGLREATYTQLRHLFVTGRMPSGENLTAITRDAGSGTRNGAMNSIGIDPSWGMGENVGVKNDDPAGVPANDRCLSGPNFLPSNKAGSGGLERTVKNTRLGVGTTGAERGKTQSWLLQHQTELLGVKNDLAGGTVFARPTIDNLLDNDLNGYNVEGPETFASIGDPRAASAADGGTGYAGAFDPFVDLNNNGVYDMGEPFTDLNGNGVRDATNAEDGLLNSNPAIRNHFAAAYLNNVTRSINAFVSFGPNQADFSPGEYLAFNFILVAGADYVPNPLDPKSIIPNPGLNQFLQDQIRANNTIFNQPYYNAYDDSFGGIVPTRTPLAVGAYTDGSSQVYVRNGTGGSSTIAAGGQIPLRNTISFDFNGDGVRDINDTCDMIGAWRRYNAGGSWNAPDGIYGAGSGADLSIDLIGDGNNDGSFTAADVRYFADGLALSSGTLDRKAAFVRVDTCFGGNFFGTTLAHGTYANGASRADVAGAAGTTPGFAPVGADGVVDAKDIDYVYKQFKQNPATGGGAAHWGSLSEAAYADLSADTTGDLVIDQDDVLEILGILGTTMGDVNLDGAVDGADLALAQGNLGQPGGWASGDVDGDGMVTQADLDIIGGGSCQWAGGCPADFNGSGGTPDDADVSSFFSAWNLGDACADVNQSGGTPDDADVSTFFLLWNAGGC